MVTKGVVPTVVLPVAVVPTDVVSIVMVGRVVGGGGGVMVEMVWKVAVVSAVAVDPTVPVGVSVELL